MNMKTVAWEPRSFLPQLKIHITLSSSSHHDDGGLSNGKEQNNSRVDNDLQPLVCSHSQQVDRSHFTKKFSLPV